MISKKSAVLFLIFTAVATATGWFLVRETRITGESLDKVSFVPVQISKKSVDDADLLDTSSWKTYRNEEYGFELKYPENWSFVKEEKSYFNHEIFRYMKFTNTKNRVYINFGLKKGTETNVRAIEFNTGIPGGEFISHESRKFGKGIVEERDLTNCDLPNRKCVIELIWFCAPNTDKDSFCGEFSVGNDKFAFLEARYVSEVDTEGQNEIRVILNGMATSFQLLE